MNPNQELTRRLVVGTLIGCIGVVSAVFVWLVLWPMWLEYRVIRALKEVQKSPGLEVTAKGIRMSHPPFNQRVFDRDEFKGDRGADALAGVIEDERQDASLRNLAAHILRGIGPQAKAAVPRLVSALQGKDEHGRYCAASVIGTIGPAARDSVPALIEATKVGYWQTRIYAAWSLGEIGPEAKAAAPALAELRDDNSIDDAILHDDSNPDRSAREYYLKWRDHVQKALEKIDPTISVSHPR